MMNSIEFEEFMNTILQEIECIGTEKFILILVVITIAIMMMAAKDFSMIISKDGL